MVTQPTTAELLQELAPNVSPQRIASVLYDQKTESDVIAARQSGAYRMLDLFNSFCAEHDIPYFSLADTLVGAVAYGDFIPGKSDLEVGMLRSDYLRFEQAYIDAGGIDPSGYASTIAGASFEESDHGDAADPDQGQDRAADENATPRKRAGQGGKGKGDDSKDANDADAIAPIDEGMKEAWILARNNSASTSSRFFDVNYSLFQTGTDSADRIQVPEMDVEEGEYADFHLLKDAAVPFVLESHIGMGKQRRRQLKPYVHIPGYCIAKRDGAVLFNHDHMPTLFVPQIGISVFDAIPDDYDASRFLFWRLKQMGKAIEIAGDRLPGSVGAETSARITEACWNLADSFNAEAHLDVARLVPNRSVSAPLESLFPTRPLPFGPTTIMAPKETKAWVNEDREQQDRQVAKLQADAKQIISEIDRICRANDIGYFVCGGTMLGYVRHGGFIPWDDDMDIGMLRADYERFLEVAPSQIDTERFFLQTRESDPMIPYLFAKVRMNNSEYVTKYNEFRDFHKGICVDLFPFDRVPFEIGGLPAFHASLRPLIREHNKIANRSVDRMPSVEPKTLTDRIAREVLTLRHERWRSHSLAESQQNYQDAVTAYNDVEGFKYVASFVPTFTMVSLDDLLPYQDIDFDGLRLKAPAKPEVFLQMQYGDFMTMPMPHQQLGHDLVWWSDPENQASDFGVKRPVHAEPKHHDSLLSKARSNAPTIVGAVGAVGLALAFARRKKNR